MTATTTENPYAFRNALFVKILLAVLFYYAVWLASFWPGVLGLDSLGILKEVEDPDVNRSGKTVFWYYFVSTFYRPGLTVELPIAIQLVLSALVFARILCWQWSNGLKKTFFFTLLFFTLSPHLTFFLGTLYPDGVYSIAVAGLCFEIWIIASKRSLEKIGLLIIATTLPFALFARSNGIIFLIPVIIAAFFVIGRQRLAIFAVTAAWLAANFVGTQLHKSEGIHGAIQPLVLFETVNFLQPRPMNLWTAEPRITPRTIEILTKHRPLPEILAYYDRDYWDTLIFPMEGPRLLDIPHSERRKLVRDFFRYNLWHNIPDFVSSRVHIFLVSSLAQGGFPDHDSAQQILPLIQSKSEFRKWDTRVIKDALRNAYDFSFKHRWLFWSPLPGIIILLVIFALSAAGRDKALLLVSVPLILQLGGIVFFSIAGEYRYIMPFFALTPLLLTILAKRPKVFINRHE